jgi:hypothetical protein
MAHISVANRWDFGDRLAIIPVVVSRGDIMPAKKPSKKQLRKSTKLQPVKNLSTFKSPSIIAP